MATAIEVKASAFLSDTPFQPVGGGPPPQWLVLAVYLAHSATLALDFTPLTWLVGGLDIYIVSWLYFQRFTGAYMDALIAAMQIFGLVLVGFNHIMLRARQRDFVKTSQPSYYVFDKSRPLFTRFRDGVLALAAFRGVGWAFQVRGIPQGRPANFSRVKFVWENLVGILWRVLYCDARRLLFLRFIHSQHDSLLEVPVFPAGFFLGALMILESRFIIETPYLLLRSVAVVVGWGTPADWPPLFGAFHHARSVRTFWSRSWHQLMRFQAEPPVKRFVHDLLGLKHGTLLSNYGHVFGNFLVAFVSHGLPRAVAGGGWLCDWEFFMGQALAIALEDICASFAIKSGIVKSNSRISATLGHLWAFAFMTYSWLRWCDLPQQMGGFKSPAFGVSVIEPLSTTLLGALEG